MKKKTQNELVGGNNENKQKECINIWINGKIETKKWYAKLKTERKNVKNKTDE